MNDTNAEDAKTMIVDVGGMHCPNCDTLVEQRFKAIAGVKSVDADHTTGRATITHTGALDVATLQSAVADDGYAVAPEGEGAAAKNTSRDYLEIGAAFALLLGLYLLLRQFNVIPNTIGVSDDMSYSLAFVIGLVASVSTCMAVTGGLLVAAAAKYNEVTGAQPGAQRIVPLLYFNAGRLISYAVLGGVIGAIGSTLMLSSRVNGVITILASAAMIVIGLQMLKLLPSFGRLMPRTSRAFTQKLHDLAGREAKGGAFALGAATFFLPCGFTQALQLYVLATGDALTGGLTMLAFALGTAPALMSLSLLSGFAKGGFQRHFLRFAGAAVVVLGLLNIQYGLVLGTEGGKPADVAALSEPAPVGVRAQIDATGQQVLSMKVSDLTYTPNQFVVTEGIPVEWRIDGVEAGGCGRMLMVPGLGIREIMAEAGETVIRFTPPAAGVYDFNCGMGMMTANSKITVVPRS